MAFSKEKAHEKAERFAAKGQHDRAAREYQAIVEHDPKDVRAWLMLADCLVRSGDRAGAVARYLQVADFYASQQQSEKALAVYRQVLNLDPSRADIQLKCANINLVLGRTHDAVAAFEQVAQAQMHSGRVAEALSTYRVIADAEPTAVSKRLRLAELYSRERQVDEAVEAFRKAGQQLLAAGRKTDYVRVAERLIYHRNDDKETIRQLARVYLELGDPRRALMKLNALLHADQSDEEGLELLAETFMTLRKPDKAVSVLVELVRALRAKGPEGQREALRVLQQGLRWDPNHAELHRLRAELEVTVAQEVDQADAAPLTPIQEDESAPLELDDGDVVELAEDDFEAEEDLELAEAKTDVQIRRPAAGGASSSMTATVMQEVGGGAGAGADDMPSDLDKILFEARVYVKYRLYEHALDHIGELLAQEPDHVGALGLRARALGELGRRAEAADTHAKVAALVQDRDPKLGREHVVAALEMVPNHERALALYEVLGGSQAASAPTPGASDFSDGIPLDLDDAGDSDVIDLMTADDDDLAFDITEADDRTGSDASRQFPVENRFGISEAGPLPQNDAFGLEEDEPTELEPEGIELDSANPPTSSFEPMRGGLEVELDELPTAQAPGPDELDHTLVGVPGGDPQDQTLPGRPRSSLREPDHTEPVPVEEGATEQMDLELEGVVPGALDDAELEDDEPTLPSASEVSLNEPLTPVSTPNSAPFNPEPRREEWPDISEDLAEVRFFIDQGLDDDAEFALADLRRRFPGHPELERFGQEEEPPPPTAATSEGAQPLMALEDVDEEEDAYLAAIFDGGSDEPRKERESRAIAEVEGADARTLFDLGMAYREMGLVDEAITQFQAASKDRMWQSRALVMMATLRVHRGETEHAVSDLRKAIACSNTEDERCEANYELGLLYEKIGDTPAAIEQLKAVSAGFRDRDERLDQLLG